MDLLTIFEKGEYSKVVDYWTSEQLQASSDPNTAYIAAAAYFRLGDLDKACGLCESLEGAFLNDANFLSMYAAILRRLNLFSRAEQIFKQALSISPNSKEIKNNYSNLLIDQNRHEEAISILKSILKISPDYTDARINLERAEFIQKQTKDDCKTHNVNTDSNKSVEFFGDPLDKAFEIDEVSKAGAKLGSLTASISEVLSDPKQKNVEQAELEMLNLAKNQIQSKQYHGALEILQKIRSRSGIYGPLYKISSDALIGLERFKEAEIHAMLAFVNGEHTIANFINLASLSAMRKDQLMAQYWTIEAEKIDKSSSLVKQCKDLLFPENKSREIDAPFS